MVGCAGDLNLAMAANVSSSPWGSAPWVLPAPPVPVPAPLPPPPPPVRLGSLALIVLAVDERGESFLSQHSVPIWLSHWGKQKFICKSNLYYEEILPFKLYRMWVYTIDTIQQKNIVSNVFWLNSTTIDGQLYRYAYDKRILAIKQLFRDCSAVFKSKTFLFIIFELS